MSSITPPPSPPSTTFTFSSSNYIIPSSVSSSCASVNQTQRTVELEDLKEEEEEDEDIVFMKFLFKKSKTEHCDLWKTVGDILADLLDKRHKLLLHSDRLSTKQKVFLDISSRLFINPEESEVDVDERPSSKKIKLERPGVGSSGLQKKDMEDGSSETRLSDIEFTFETNDVIWGTVQPTIHSPEVFKEI